MSKINDFSKSIFKSKFFDFALLLCACIAPFFDLEVLCGVIFVIVGTAVLLFSDDISDFLLVFLLFVVNITVRVDLAEYYLKVWYLTILVAPAFVLHFIIYRKKIEVGKTFLPLCLVAIAITMGGAFTITSYEYFSPSALFYTLGLGIVMVIFYILIKSALSDSVNAKANSEHFMKCMYYAGILTFVIVLSKYVRSYREVLETKQFLMFDSRNNFATFLMITMPFPAYFATKEKRHFFMLLAFMVGIFLTNSRGGLIFGSLEFVIILVYIFVYSKNDKKFYIVTYSILALIAVVGISGLIALYGSRLSSGLFSTEETRWKMLLRSFEDFLKNPIFGVGLGYNGNRDIFDCAMGEICWYHLLVPQIYASLGIVGVGAFAYQYFVRIKLWFKNRSDLTTALLLTNIGLTLMGFVNPGCFSPFPIELTSVIAFILIENIEKEKTGC